MADSGYTSHSADGLRHVYGLGPRIVPQLPDASPLWLATEQARREFRAAAVSFSNQEASEGELLAAARKLRDLQRQWARPAPEGLPPNRSTAVANAAAGFPYPPHPVDSRADGTTAAQSSRPLSTQATASKPGKDQDGAEASRTPHALAAESFPRDLRQGLRPDNGAGTSSGQSASSAARRQPDRSPRATRGPGRQ